MKDIDKLIKEKKKELQFLENDTALLKKNKAKVQADLDELIPKKADILKYLANKETDLMSEVHRKNEKAENQLISIANLEEEVKAKNDEAARLLEDAQSKHNQAMSEKSRVDDQKQKNAETILIFDNLIAHIESELNKIK